MKQEVFNLIIAGYGGQGVLTLAEIVAKAALKQGFDVKESELHGLAQRGGSLECHVRFGESINSPLVMGGCADLILGLEAFEALRACYWASSKTAILMNSRFFNFRGMDLKEILSRISSLTQNVHVVDAEQVVEKLTGDIAATNIFMLGYALKQNLLPLKKEIVWQTIQERLHKKFLEENKKVFEAALK